MIRRLLPAAVVGLALAGCASTPAEDPAAAATRTVTHAHGTTEVPAAPARVVVLEPVQLDTTVALGAVPVGAAVLSEAAGVPAYLKPDADAVQTVGTVPTPDLEKIAALRPDLILGTESRHAELYDRLAAVAPTVFMASQADPWQDNVRFVGRALGREADAEALLGAYTDRCAEVGATHPGGTAQLVRPRDGQLTLYGPASFAGSTLECAGFRTPPRDWEGSISVDLSPELVLQARADLVVVTAAKAGDESAVPAEMAAVRAEAFPDLHVVDQSIWITGVGPRGGQAVLDDLERLLAG
ncbi:ABC transporter substrate-binding protein [Pseudonocardia oroxyli]|uniref:Iron complex transport system substrate-binding protein n=1 Tax=Pseudonocardia oroxyli TaxID=366584 RepID=A0A1G7NHH0_PSEOR|nr:ABC transporter substrate-binding protein [Pseudonocardia oroxyli]SDF73514.1 iron complex transport system substrate-binding protein [Pseudonocardia oroxyli]